jgi:hypothetical protein
MTSLLGDLRVLATKLRLLRNKFVISTGAQRSGEICGFLRLVLKINRLSPPNP